MLRRKAGSTSASCNRTRSTLRPTIFVSFELRSTMRSRLVSRRSTRTSTSLSGVSDPVAAEPKSNAKRTFCSVRSASLSLESNGHLPRTYRRSDIGRARVLAVGRTPWSAPSLIARRKVLSCTPNSLASTPNSVICPLYRSHMSILTTLRVQSGCWWLPISGIGGRPRRRSSLECHPLAPNQLPVPAQQRGRREHQLAGLKVAAEGDQDQAISWQKIGAFDLAA